jgi:hypothetical protein
MALNGGVDLDASTADRIDIALGIYALVELVDDPGWLSDSSSIPAQPSPTANS